MKIQKDKILRVLLYTGFGLLCFVYFLALTFPVALVEKQLLLVLKQETGCEVSLGESRYQLPTQISWRDISGHCPKRLFGRGQRGNFPFALKTLDLQLSPLSLLFEQTGEIDFKLSHKKGIVPGTLRISQQDQGLFFELQLEEAQINIDEEGLAGKIRLSGEGRWHDKLPQQGSGTLAFTIEDARIEKWDGVSLPLGEVTFETIEGQISLKEMRLLIENFSARGAMADIESTGGQILLRQVLNNSLLNVSLEARPKDGLEDMAKLFVKGYAPGNPIKIRLSGSIRSPKLAVNGKNMRLGF